MNTAFKRYVSQLHIPHVTGSLLNDHLLSTFDVQYPTPDQAVRFEDGPQGLQPPHDCVTLDDYRARHGLYRQDPGVQALSASAALIAIWDDHEVANNDYVDGAENQHPGGA